MTVTWSEFPQNCPQHAPKVDAFDTIQKHAGGPKPMVEHWTIPQVEIQCSSSIGGIRMLRRGFVVDVQVDHLVVRVTGTSYVASFYRADDSAELIVKHLPLRDDHRAPMSRLDFIKTAWQLAKDKAEELKWIA